MHYCIVYNEVDFMSVVSSSYVQVL